MHIYSMILYKSTTKRSRKLHTLKLVNNKGVNDKTIKQSFNFNVQFLKRSVLYLYIYLFFSFQLELLDSGIDVALIQVLVVLSLLGEGLREGVHVPHHHVAAGRHDAAARRRHVVHHVDVSLVTPSPTEVGAVLAEGPLMRVLTGREAAGRIEVPQGHGGTRMLLLLLLLLLVDESLAEFHSVVSEFHSHSAPAAPAEVVLHGLGKRERLALGEAVPAHVRGQAVQHVIAQLAACRIRVAGALRRLRPAAGGVGHVVTVVSHVVRVADAQRVLLRRGGGGGGGGRE